MSAPRSTSSRNSCPSCRFRIPEDGGRAIWQITNRCNYNCCYCIFASRSAAVPGELDTRAMLAALDSLAEEGFTQLKITGGEPFIRPDLLQLVERAGSLGLLLDISTNASLITPAAAGRLREAGVQLMHISLDGDSAELHETLRGKGTFARTLAGLSCLRAANLRLRIGCVIWRDNERRLGEMAAFCLNLGVQTLAFSMLEPAGRLPLASPLLARRDGQELKAEIEKLTRAYHGRMHIQHNLPQGSSREQTGGCPGGTRFLFIDNLGRVSPCTWVVEREPRYRTAASLAAMPLKPLLASAEVGAYRELLKERKSNGCYGCPTQK